MERGTLGRFAYRDRGVRIAGGDEPSQGDTRRAWARREQPLTQAVRAIAFVYVRRLPARRLGRSAVLREFGRGELALDDRERRVVDRDQFVDLRAGDRQRRGEEHVIALH